MVDNQLGERVTQDTRFCQTTAVKWGPPFLAEGYLPVCSLIVIQSTLSVANFVDFL